MAAIIGFTRLIDSGNRGHLAQEFYLVVRSERDLSTTGDRGSVRTPHHYPTEAK